jgi:MscS family membrane protein
LFWNYIAGIFNQAVSFKIYSRAFLPGTAKSFVEYRKENILITIGTLDKLRFPSVLDFDVFHITSREIIESLGSAIIIIFFIWLLLRIIDFIATVIYRKAGPVTGSSQVQIIAFFGDFFKIIIVIAGILLLMQFAFHKDISAWLGGVGIATAAVALAAKESLENVIASFIIFFNKPFHLGDLVKVNGVTGNVEKIGLRSTRIRTDQKTYVTVPNKQMVDSIVDNLTLRTQRRADIKLEISLNTSSDQLQQLMDGIKRITQHPEIKDKLVLLNEITNNAYVINLEYYTGTIPITAFNELKQAISLSIIKLIESLKIELAGLNTAVKLTGNLS